MATLLTPRFWDLHLHGVAGIDFMNADEDEMVHACEHLGRHGTGVFAPTLLTAEPALLRDACRRWGSFLEKARSTCFLPKHAARPLGLHLEGPFLSPPMAGAHPKRWLRPAKVSEATDLIRAASGQVAIITLAPELPGAAALTRRLVAQGVRVQLGHTQATDTQALNVVHAGAGGITHLFNAMRTHHRSPGVLTALRRKLVTAEIITDGVHLDPDFVLWCWNAARDHLYAVSDGCSAIGARKNTPLTLGSLKLEKRGTAAVVAGTDTLAGGATYLAHHPRWLAAIELPARDRRALLGMFYKIQRSLFPEAATHVIGRNHFDSNTLCFLGSDA